MLGAAGIPAGAVLDTKELTDDADLRSSAASCRRSSIRMARTFKMPAWPVRHNGSTADGQAGAAAGRAHGEVLESWLGLDQRRGRQAGRDGQGDSAA